MKRKNKNGFKVLFIIFLLIIAITFVGGNLTEKISTSMKHTTSTIFKENNSKTLNLEYQEFSDLNLVNLSSFFSVVNSNTVSLDISDKTLDLDKYIKNTTISYREGDNWIEITDENNENLSAGVNYQIQFEYENIFVKDLISSNGQMSFNSLPKWFKPNETGVLLYGSDIVAQIDALGETILITFDTDWLNKLQQDASLSGTFKVSGKVDWNNIPGNENTKLPGLDINLNFENDLIQKYGNANIEKSDATIEEKDGNYYLKYEIKVTSLEDSPISNIKVIDTFSELEYISCYVGVSDKCDSPTEFLPNQDQTKDNLSIDNNSMIWNIGELEAGDERILTYYAKISDEYINELLTKPIQNKVELYAGDYLKNTDSTTYKPTIDVKLDKKADRVEVDSTGNGTIIYTITITAPNSNSYAMKNLKLKDFFPNSLKNYLSGTENGKLTININDESKTIDYNNATFELDDITLKPGESAVIKYTIKVNNIFDSNNGNIELTNTATLTGENNRTFKTVTNTETLRQSSWVRKMYGGLIESKTTINKPESTEIYKYDESNIVKEEDEDTENFDVPKGSLKYQIVVNEDGRWDLSSTSMKDSFGGYMKYVGYVQIQVYNKYPTENGEQVDDSELIKKLNDSQAVKTVWLDINNLSSFKFEPEYLGLNEKYTYLLTYYAQPVDIEDVGSILVTNDFEITGTIGEGEGARTLPSIKVSVNNVVQGGIHYKGEKSYWYYENSPVYQTEAVDSEYNETTFNGDYTNGALYWIIKLEGTIKKGEWKSQNKFSTTFDGFYVKDTPTNSKFNRDALVGVYVGPDSFDFTQFNSFEEFLKEENNLEKLNGNPKNDKYFKGTAVSNADYEWYAENDDLNGIVFAKDYDLEKDNKAIYIVLRTTPTAALPTSNTGYVVYKNSLSFGMDGTTPIEVDTAEYAYAVESSLYKESKGAYTYDADTKKITNVSTFESNDDWTEDTLKAQFDHLGSGTYAAWLLNVNWDGTMEGSAIVSDQLPEGLELSYVDIWFIGKDVRDENTPATSTIDELENSDDWMKLEHTSSRGYANAITYYNPKTREIRWNITNLTKDENGVSYDKRQINLRIISKVVDHDVLLSGQGKTFVNQASSGDVTTTADVFINRKSSMDKFIDLEVLGKSDGTDENGNISSTTNSIPFKIEINPLSEDLAEGTVLPPLIDELSEKLILIEDSLKITYSDGKPYNGYSYAVEEKDGKQTIIISNLPDSTPLTITYNVRVDAKPNEKVKVSNRAYWAGYPPGDAQVDNEEFQYDHGGDVFTDHPVTIEITKVDSDSHNKKLAGAEFELYVEKEDKEFELVGKAITDKKGKVKFEDEENTENKLKTNTVYYVKESKAPNGYELDETLHYFVIVSDVHNTNFDNYEINGNKIDLDVWYDSPNYSCVIENRKGSISLEKIFKDENGEEIDIKEGKYKFGLFDANNKLLETLTIEYTEEGERYYLDDVPKDKPYFTKYDPESIYYVYELDGDGKIIKNKSVSKLYGTTYKVTYEVGDKATNRVTVNSKVTITNSINTTDFPIFGGNGVLIYYVLGSVLILSSMCYYLIKRCSKLFSK